jgi:hypothetical protein
MTTIYVERSSSPLLFYEHPITYNFCCVALLDTTVHVVIVIDGKFLNNDVGILYQSMPFGDFNEC